jgi:hypothetical protein
VNRVEFGLGVCETKNSAATPFSSLPFTCLHGTLNVPIFDLGSVNFTRCFRLLGAATTAVALRR